MAAIIRFAWKRFGVIGAALGDIQGRAVATLFYFTILVPFGIISRLFTDPMHLKVHQAQTYWVDRPPVPEDLENAKRQG